MLHPFVFQELTFSGFSDTDSVKEVQTVDITSAGYFRLGLYGVYTGRTDPYCSQNGQNPLEFWPF